MTRNTDVVAQGATEVDTPAEVPAEPTDTGESPPPARRDRTGLWIVVVIVVGYLIQVGWRLYLSRISTRRPPMPTKTATSSPRGRSSAGPAARRRKTRRSAASATRCCSRRSTGSPATRSRSTRPPRGSTRSSTRWCSRSPTSSAGWCCACRARRRWSPRSPARCCRPSCSTAEFAMTDAIIATLGLAWLLLIYQWMTGPTTQARLIGAAGAGRVVGFIYPSTSAARCSSPATGSSRRRAPAAAHPPADSGRLGWRRRADGRARPDPEGRPGRRGRVAGPQSQGADRGRGHSRSAASCARSAAADGQVWCRRRPPSGSARSGSRGPPGSSCNQPGRARAPNRPAVPAAGIVVSAPPGRHAARRARQRGRPAAQRPADQLLRLPALHPLPVPGLAADRRLALRGAPAPESGGLRYRRGRGHPAAGRRGLPEGPQQARLAFLGFDAPESSFLGLALDSTSWWRSRRVGSPSRRSRRAVVPGPSAAAPCSTAGRAGRSVRRDDGGHDREGQLPMVDFQYVASTPQLVRDVQARPGRHGRRVACSSKMATGPYNHAREVTWNKLL